MIRSGRPEVLAPAGDPVMLRAAVAGGADAVYLGLRRFGARARARNFDLSELTLALRWLHDHGRRGYVTLNTLLLDAELPELELTLRALAAAGADAVIVQDLGLFALARAVAPSLPLHASTQLTVSDAAGAAAAAELGAVRVTLARELSLREIAAIAAEATVELEVFVHGALCLSYSGQCLASQALARRSANRGVCAQLCRLPHALLIDGTARPHGEQPYPLSPCDLDASELVPELLAAGVAALKIEGRMKSPAYAAATAALYRACVDAATEPGAPSPAPELRQTALQTFTRGSGLGHLAGRDPQRLVEGRGSDHRGLHVGTVRRRLRRHGQERLEVELIAPLDRGDGVVVEVSVGDDQELGGKVWTLTLDGHDVAHATPGRPVELWFGPQRPLPAVAAGRRLFRTHDPARAAAAEALAARRPEPRRLHLRLEGTVGQHPQLTGATEDGVEASVSLPVVLPEAAESMDPEAPRKKLGRLGESPFVAASIELALPARGYVPPSALNRARRALVEALLDRGHRVHATADTTLEALLTRPPRPTPRLPDGLVVLCREPGQTAAALAAGADAILLDLRDLTLTAATLRALRAAGALHVGVALPRVATPASSAIVRQLLKLAPDVLLLRNLGQLPLVATGIPCVADTSLNVTNRLAAATLLQRGVQALTPAHDLDTSGLLRLLDGSLALHAEVLLHASLPLFHTAHCFFAAHLSSARDAAHCGRPCRRRFLALQDRTGLELPIRADMAGHNTVFHGTARSFARLVPELRRRGVGRFRIELLAEDADATARLVSDCRRRLDQRPPPAPQPAAAGDANRPHAPRPPRP